MRLIILCFILLIPLTAEAPATGVPASVKPSIVDAQVEVLKNELGIKESRQNRGIEIRKYQKETGAFNSPWCVSFLAYTYNKNSNSFGLGDVLPKIASSQRLYHWAKENDYLTEDPDVGDIVVWRRGYTNKGHAGAIIERLEDSLITIEGNTRVGSKRDGVYRKKRYAGRKTGNLRLRGYIDMSKVWQTARNDINVRLHHHFLLYSYSDSSWWRSWFWSV